MAFDPCCTTIIGGEVYITATFQGGGSAPSRFEALGDVRIQPSSIERTAGASSGGTVWVTEASRPVRALLSFINRCTPNPMKLFCGRCNIDILIVEKSRGVTHSMTKCTIVGLPEINLSTGEITGIEVVCNGWDYSISADEDIEPKWCGYGKDAIYNYGGTGETVEAATVTA